MSNTAKKARNVAVLGGGALVAAPFVAVGTAEAGTITVSNLNNSGDGSLRQAVLVANSNAGADTITFAAGLHGTITLTSGPIKFESSIDLQGPGADLLTVDGNGGRLFYAYDNETTIDVTISGMTLTGAVSSYYGGAVTVWGEHMTLDEMVITGNTTTALGGGIFVSNNSAAELDDLRLVVRNSTISGNQAALGGGGIGLYRLAKSDESTVLIENSTISGNSTPEYGGGVLLGSGSSPVRVVNSTISGNTAVFGAGVMVYQDGTNLVLEHSTVTANVGEAPLGAGSIAGTFGAAEGPGAVFGAGILTLGGLTIDHSVVSGNVADERPDVVPYGDGTVTATYSMVGDLDGETLDGTNNLPEGDAKLGALADNGGPTMTHMPQAGSPLIDAGDPSFASPPATDQRGLGRVANGRIDIGAVEAGSSVLPPTGGSNGLLATLGAGLLGLGGALHLMGRRKRSA